MPRRYTVIIFAIMLSGAVFLSWRTRPSPAQQVVDTSAKQVKQPAPPLPIGQVILFSSGVGYFQREGEIQGRTHVDLSFPSTDVNDLLKSLVLQDMNGGHISTITYDSPDPLEKTLKSFALDLTNNRYNQGVASQIDVVQARTQLEQTRAQSTDTMVQRNQFEHAIAIIIGKPPSALSIAFKASNTPPPPVPVGIPSQLLERRPDIAANERRVAAANANVGVAQAAFYPDITLSAAGGLEGTSIMNLFSWPSRFWSLGSTVNYTLLDFGKRQGTLEQAQASYDAAVAVYRQSVLTAFQSVEDNLSTLRVLEEEDKQQAAAVAAAERSLELAINQYQGGITAYLQVITAQAIALSNEETAVQLLTRRMVACVSLIQAIGGDFNVSGLPAPQEVAPWKGVQGIAKRIPAATQ